MLWPADLIMAHNSDCSEAEPGVTLPVNVRVTDTLQAGKHSYRYYGNIQAHRAG